METVHIDTGFLLRAVNLELAKADEAVRELNRLATIGYRNSQTGLDVARSAKEHLMKARDLIEPVNIPMAEPAKRRISEAIGRQDYIIWSIELYLK